jgi:hypothetical protein
MTDRERARAMKERHRESGLSIDIADLEAEFAAVRAEERERVSPYLFGDEELAEIRAEARAQALEEAARLCDASDKLMRPIGCETAGELAADIRALPGAKVTP